jgi:hypothetical protein
MTKIHNAYQLQLLMEAAQLRIEAAKIPCGRARDALLQRINRIELSATVEGWMNSPGLRCPEESPNDETAHKPKPQA